MEKENSNVNVTVLFNNFANVLNYISVMARPMVMYQNDHPITWTPVYAGGKVCTDIIHITKQLIPSVFNFLHCGHMPQINLTVLKLNSMSHLIDQNKCYVISTRDSL